MPRIDLSWTWEFDSPLHCGSGISRPGRADRLVQRDEKGNPLIPGDAVKGALRMSAEQVAAWLGCPQDYATDPAEPKCEPIAVLFGGLGQTRFTPALWVDPEIKDRSPFQTVASTAINSETGVARNESLRMVEVIAPGACFKASCSIRVDEAAFEPATTLLLAALSSTESLGGKAGIGWGRMKLQKVEMSGDDGQTIDKEEALSPDRLNRLREALKKPAVSPIGSNDSSGEKSQKSASMVWRKIEITLKEPTCLSVKPDVSNKVATEEVIPATTLRGALRAQWLREKKTEAEIESWLGRSTRWSPGFPADENLAPYIPVPLSYACVKGEKGFGSPHGIHDALGGERPQDKDEGGRAIQWRGVSARRMSVVDSDKPRLEKQETKIEVRMHVARDYRSGSKREAALYAREAIAPTDARFIAWALVPEDFPQGEGEIFLGKRTSAGNGKASIGITDGSPVWPPLSKPLGIRTSDVRDVYVELLSPAIVRGADGFPLRSLSVKEWTRIVNGHLKREERLGSGGLLEENGETGENGGSILRTSSRRMGGWMSTWGHSRKPTVCIEEGSAWRLRCNDKAAADKLRGVLTQLQETGLGERTHEGFGWILVDPAWLGSKTPLAEADDASDRLKPPQSENLPKPPGRWPGCESVVISSLEDLVGHLPKEVHPEARGPLQELALRARMAVNADQCRQALAFCEEMATRKKPHQWEYLKQGEPMRNLLEETKEDPVLFCFTIEALLVRAKEGVR